MFCISSPLLGALRASSGSVRGQRWRRFAQGCRVYTRLCISSRGLSLPCPVSTAPSPPYPLSSSPSLPPYLTRRRGGVLVPHPHHHGSTALQAGGSTMRVLIVEDRPDIHGIPDQYSEMPELVLAVQVRLLCCNALLSTSLIKIVFLLVA